MYKTLSGKELSLSKKIAKGGEGEVYEILGDNDNCIKIYYERIRSQEKEEKLKYMVLNPPDDLQGITHKICWPKEVIYKEGIFVGFLMPKAFDDSLLPYHLCQPLIPKKLSSQWHATFDRKTFKGIASRLKLSVNVVAIVNRIHRTNKYIIVDLKPQNLLVTAFGKVSIIDLDSVQITQNDLVLFNAPVSTPEYTPPEAREVIKSKSAISKDWDIFSLGILIYEILCGIHPYVGSAKAPHKNLNTIQEKIKVNLTHITKGESAFSTLPTLHQTFYNYNTDLKNIFKRMFSPYILNVSVRPRLEDFGETLFNAVALLEEEFKKEEQKRLEQEKIKKKREELEAIKNYKKLKESNKQLKDDYQRAINKLVVHKSDNTILRKQVEETKSKSNALVPVLVTLLLLFMGLFIGNYISNNKKFKENNLPLEQYETDISSNNYKSLTLDNNSNQNIWVAIGYVDCDLEYHYSNKKSTGWYNIESGKELSLDLISILGDEKYFRCGKLWLYAENSEKSFSWSGENNNNHFILHDHDKFNYTEWIPPAKRSKNIRKEKFFEILLDQGVTRQSFINSN
jgi:hypothetical protein